LPDTLEGLEERPEAGNLVTIYAALADITPAEVLALYGGQGFGQFKPALADLAVAKLGPIRDRLVRLLDDRAEVVRVLERGAERARAIAGPVLREAQDAMGLQL
jgi:tryptophanyl-tRNA synthetase